MARAHWRFIVRDQYGFAIQNAQVNVFQPGTSTAFTGSAFDAVTAGNAVTNPLTSNNQGEVQAWFDTPQAVDVSVNDNTDAAYRAIDGPTQPVSFTTFIEADNIIPAVSDIFLLTTDHGATEHDTTVSDNPHGIADHTDIIRKIWLPVNDGAVIDTGTLTTSGANPNAFRTVSLADAASSGVAWAFIFDDWASGALSLQVYFAGSTTNANPVRWQITTHSVANGGDITAAGTTVTYTSISVATANMLIKDTLTSTTVTPVNGDLVRINLRRLGADGADAYTGAALVLGIMLSYTASQ